MPTPEEISNLCRLCLEKRQVSVLIFEEQTRTRSTFVKISSCLPVKVSKSDALPKKICEVCSGKLDSFYEFWKQSSESEKQLQDWLKQPPPEPAPDPMPVLKQEEVDFKGIGYSNSESAPSTSILSSILQTQVSDEPPLKKTKFVTEPDTILHTYDSDEEIEAKVEQIEDNSNDSNSNGEAEGLDYGDDGQVNPDNPDDQPGPSGVGKSSDETPIKDEVNIKEEKQDREEIEEDYDETVIEDIKNNVLPPLKTLLTKNKRKKQVPRKARRKLVHEGARTCQTIMQHVDQSLNEPVRCEICDETFPSNVKFALHSINHNDNGKYSCQFCDYKNTSKYHIVMHVKAHEGTTKYKCEICNKAFTVSTHAAEHKYFHTGEKPFQCEICGKHFMFSRFLSAHRRTLHWEIMTGTPLVKYDCNTCNKHYTSLSGLKRHNKSKHNETGLTEYSLCDICGKQLSSAEKLKFHRRTHTGFKPYSCQYCSKSFTKKENLKEHERVHTGERPYLCKFCGKGFTQRSPLKLHERIHTGERPHFCKMCNRGFISKGVMDTHMKSCAGPLFLIPELPE